MVKVVAVGVVMWATNMRLRYKEENPEGHEDSKVKTTEMVGLILEEADCR